MTTDELVVSRLRAASLGRKERKPFISVVIPALNEEDNVSLLVDRLSAVLARFTESFEIIFVSDGSTDQTCPLVKYRHAIDPRAKLIHLSRSFGHQNAILAGLDHANGQIVITMDGDLQHPPEAIPDMLAEWEKGADVVHAVRRPKRQGSPLVRQCKRIGYALLKRLSEVDIVPQSADFRLYDRRAVLAMRALRERSRFNRGLARWIGFRQAIVHIDEHERHAGTAKYSLPKLLRLLTDGVFSLSSKPLQYMGFVGLSLSMLSAVYLIVVLVGYTLNLPGYRAIGGWASTVAVVLCMSGIQLTALWLMSQYMGRTYDEVKRRPHYIIADTVGFDDLVETPAEDEPRRVPRRNETPPPTRRPVAELELEACEQV